MAPQEAFVDPVPLFVPCSRTSTEVNKTGSWRYLRPTYTEKTAPCGAACPAGEDIARIAMLASRGLFQEAWETILQENPFPAVCGRVCFHPCEGACNRAQLDEPIAIHQLERFLGDTALAAGTQAAVNERSAQGRKAAVVGAGPAGLAAAFFLTRLGFTCEVFEAQPEPGGLLRWGIPAYRLPKEVLQGEIKRIENRGVKILCQTPVTARTLEKIKARNDALFIAGGYGRPIRLNIPGGEMACDGLSFLAQIRSPATFAISGTAAVIGGGNTALDVARTLLRRGVEPVLVYRRRRQDMPAFAPEVDMALKEGIKIKELSAPIRIAQDPNDPESFPLNYELTLQKMKVSSTAINGRARVIPDGNKIETLRVQGVFTAIGAEGDNLGDFPPGANQKHLELSHCQMALQDLPVIWGGDLATPVKSVTHAIASGKQAAIALDTLFAEGWDAVATRLSACRIGSGPTVSMAAYLGGDRERRSARVVTFDEINADYFHPRARVTPVTLDVEQRLPSFAEIEQTLVTGAAREEATRCFNCGICNACDNCRLFCPEMAVAVENTARRINLDYCKGCGICVVECPRNAMVLEEETP
ncbi:MAG: FAD-dependent oxidoreductase [Desulfobacterales bacterium]|nr:MAG: FAD-dependent oxidoreductase [Desulfobacterales bacterium]